MRILLDTHVLIWTQEAPEKLGRKTMHLLLSNENELYLCSVNAAEIACLAYLEKITLLKQLDLWLEEAYNYLGAAPIDIDDRLAISAWQLPDPFHRDPADRLLVATARARELCLLTADTRILDYPHVITLDARS